MADWLRQSMHQVSTASSLMDAKEQLVESDFDLVITDLRLGNEDGFDLIRHLRQRQGYRCAGHDRVRYTWNCGRSCASGSF